MPESRKSFLEKGPPPAPGGASSLYVHVGFCRRRCRYCDFSSRLYDDQTAERVTAAMRAELNHHKSRLERPLQTAFLGGGTPTVLAPPLLAGLLADVAACCDDATELSVEANPSSLGDETLTVLTDAGVNRLSVGVQSFNDAELSVLGRLHTAGEAGEAIGRAMEAGIANVSLDLIYGVPGQTLDSWAASLDAAVATGVSHVSCYCLTYPEGTPLAADLEAGRVEPMDEQTQRDCYDMTRQRLAEAGFEHYEISNFARPDFRCIHNLVYWRNEPYLGVGPAAVSYLAGRRGANVDNTEIYADRIEAGILASDSHEELSKKEVMAETLMLGLRLRQGVRREAFRERFVVDIMDVFGFVVKRYVDIDMLELDEDRLRIASEAVFVSDTILADLIAAAAG